MPDNLKTAVSRADRYDPEINPVFDEFARHYGMAVFPARVRKPRDKALVENAVNLVYQRIYTPLRGRSFRSLAELNAGIRELVDKHNNRALQRLGISRRELFERAERHALEPLPSEPFALKSIAIATVGANYPAHRHSWEWSAERLERWAKQVGPETEQVIAKLLRSQTYAPQAFRSCLAVLSLSRRYGSIRLNQACSRALSVGSHSGRRIAAILAQGLEQEVQPGLDLDPTPVVASHENLRGAAYFN